MKVSHETSGKAPQYPPDVVEQAFQRFRSRVFESNIIPDKFYPRKASFEPEIESSRLTIDTVEVTQFPTKSNSNSLSSEAYAIDVSCDPPLIIVETITPEGAIRAFDSLAQLFYAHSASDPPKAVYTSCAPISVKDAPEYHHRGLMLDISRNWIPPQDVKRTISAMGFNKLNKLHLHATDSQSWPLEVPSIPELAREGAYRPDLIWRAKDLEDVQRHGLYHGVEVYVEIDMPGHTGSIVHSHPEFLTAYNEHPWEKYAAEPPAGQLQLNSSDALAFIKKILEDVLPRVVPFSTSFHIGGDELNKECHRLDPTIKSSDKIKIAPHLQNFMDHSISVVTAHSLVPHVWEDMLVQWDLHFPKETVFHAWLPNGLRSVVEKGHLAIFGCHTDWYLDCGFGTFIDPDKGKKGPGVKYPYPDWSPPYKNWRQILAYDPLKDIPKDKQYLVIGGEVKLWSELTDSVTLDFMLWPRSAAAAEVLWKGKGEVGEDNTRKLAEMRERLVKTGIAAGMVQMEWALRNKGECIL